MQIGGGIIPLIFRKYQHIFYISFFALVIIAAGLFSFVHSRDNVVINEVCSSNVACCMDDKGDYPDWVELYNPTDSDIDLSGYMFNRSVDLKKEKYVFPEGTVLPSGSFYLFDPGFTIGSDGANLNLLDDKKHYIDRVSVPRLKYDTTYARAEDGSYSWEIKVPTPGYSNLEGERLNPVIAGEVRGSVPSGFYDAEFDLKLRSSNWGRKIYYTVDGSDPVKNGVLYEGPIHIYDRSTDPGIYSQIPDVSVDYMKKNVPLPSSDLDKCTVIKAVAKDLLGRYTDVSTYSYFVGFDKKTGYDNMTIVSVSADPEDLFSHEDGIMVLGSDYDAFVAAGQPDEYEGSSANFTRRGCSSERAIDIEIYDSERNNVLDSNAGIRIKGLSSRWDVQKSFSVFFRQAYGGSSKKDFTTGGKEFSLHSLALEKCGQDTATKMTDVIMDTCMADTGCATKKSVPCCLFLNGEYWGFYWLTERFDSSFFADRYGVDKDDVMVIDSDDPYFEEHGWEEGDFDRESLLEYYAGNIIVAHDGDWPQYNVRFWKTGNDEGSKYGDAKLRPVIFDMNSRSMQSPDYNVTEFLMTWYPFMNLTENSENFREDLVAMINRMSSDQFEKTRVLSLIDDLQDQTEQQMILDKMRYYGYSRDEAKKDFDKSVDIIRDFYEKRWEYLDRYNKEYLDGK